MGIFVALLLLFGLLLVGGAALAWVVFRNRETPAKLSAVSEASPTPQSAIKTVAAPSGFRWRYLLLPLVTFVVSVAATVYFYRLLPADVGYRFRSDGTADAWVGKGALVALTVVPQFLLTLLAGAVALVVTKVGGLMKAGETAMSSLSGVVAVMSNMVVMPQLVVLFTVLDIFNYNAYQIHLLSPLLSALVVMVIGGFLLIFLFYRAAQRMRMAK